MSFLVAYNGQFSPIKQNVERISTRSATVEPIAHTSGVTEFKEVLHSITDEPLPSHGPKLEVYQRHARSYQQEKKRDHAKDIMTSPVKVIAEKASVSDAVELMKKYGFRHLPVVNSMNVIIGMISDRELLAADGKSCGEVMIKNVIVSDELTSINEIAITLLNRKINALPIINNHHEVSGIITLSDILDYVIKSTPLSSYA